MSLAYNFRDEPKYEIINGEMVMMTPSAGYSHMSVSNNVNTIFKKYLKGKKCQVIYEFDVHLTEKDTFKPDITVVCNKDIIKETGIYGTPDLIIEILSTYTAKRDRGYKKDIYELAGVKEYWIIDTKKPFC